MITNLTHSGRPIGASTITQQVAKNLLLTNEVSYVRKAKEAFLAYRIESVMSKQQILELYLNQIFLGRNAYGVQRSEEHTSELQSLMRISYAVFCLKKKNYTPIHNTNNVH